MISYEVLFKSMSARSGKVFLLGSTIMISAFAALHGSEENSLISFSQAKVFVYCVLPFVMLAFLCFDAIKLAETSVDGDESRAIFKAGAVALLFYSAVYFLFLSVLTYLTPTCHSLMSV